MANNPSFSKKHNIVRFDSYMEYRLYSPSGFYTKHVNLSPQGDFTTMAFEKTFANLIHQELEFSKLVSNDFIEIGGGNGVFKKNLLEKCKNLQYISVDKSIKLGLLQEQVNGKKTIFADAWNLPFPTNSVVGSVFANELLDVFPCRIFLIESQRGVAKITKEGFVITHSNEGSELSMLKVERDALTNHYEAFLNQSHKRIVNEAVVCISFYFQETFKELLRVLRFGEIILIDYGFSDSFYALRRADKEFPYCFANGAKKFLEIEEILRLQYPTDITYNIDFDYCMFILSELAKDVSVTFEPLQFFFHRLITRSRKHINLKWMSFAWNQQFGIIKIKKQP